MALKRLGTQRCARKRPGAASSGNPHLDRSRSLRLSPTQVDLSSDGQTNKEPVAEAVVVDEPEHVLHAQVNQGHDPLQGHNTGLWVRNWPESEHWSARGEGTTDVEEKGRDGGVAFHVDHAQVVGEVALPGADKEQPAEKERCATGGRRRSQQWEEAAEAQSLTWRRPGWRR